MANEACYLAISWACYFTKKYVALHPDCYREATKDIDDRDFYLSKYGPVERQLPRWPRGQRCPLCGGATRTPKPELYKVVRRFKDSGCRRTVRRGLTHEQAWAHCNDPETSSSTCKGRKGKRRTRDHGPWMDTFERQ